MTQLLTTQSTLKDFTGLDIGEQGSGPAWLNGLRSAAAERFASLGFPTRRDEEWRFTNLSPLLETPLRLAPAGHTLRDITPYAYAGLTGTQLVFVNGRYAPELSALTALPQGVEAGTISEALERDPQTVRAHIAHYAGYDTQAFVALNTAAIEDGAFVRVPRGVVVEEPIHILSLSQPGDTPTVSHPRTLVVLGENSQATVIETYAGPADSVYFTNAVSEFFLAENAVLDHYKVQRESLAAFHIATLQAHLSRQSNFSSHSIGFGGRLVRNDANAVFSASHAECTLNGLYMASGTQLMDNHTAIDHAMPHCNSHEVYKGILDGRARGVFNGKIFVREDAQKTDAKQTNQTLLLSRDAQINAKPQLEIYADDVKCTHGATIGQLSAESLFYLRARGIPLAQARAMLTYAFAADIVRRIKVEPIRAALDFELLQERALEGLAVE